MRHLRWIAVLIPLFALLVVPKAQAAVINANLYSSHSCVLRGGEATISLAGQALPGESINVALSIQFEGSAPSYTLYPDQIADSSGNYLLQTTVTFNAAGTFELRGYAHLDNQAPVYTNAIIIKSVENLADCDGKPEPKPEPAPQPEQPDVIFAQDVADLSGEVLTVDINAWNAGQGEGDSSAVLSYDPASLQVLDAWSTDEERADWISARDDAAGTLTLSFGTIQPAHGATITVRFLRTNPAAASAIRVVRDDGLDAANPIFLDPGQNPAAPMALESVWQDDGSLWLGGDGFRPEELLMIWGNTADGQVVPISDWQYSNNDADGTLNLAVWLPDADIVSVVVRGNLSGATGVTHLK